MAFQDEYPVLAGAVHELCDAIGDIKVGLSDGDLTVSEIVAALPDSVKTLFERLLLALAKIPDEFTRLMGNPWAMMSQFVPYLMSEVQRGIFK